MSDVFASDEALYYKATLLPSSTRLSDEFYRELSESECELLYRAVSTAGDHKGTAFIAVNKLLHPNNFWRSCCWSLCHEYRLRRVGRRTNVQMDLPVTNQLGHDSSFLKIRNSLRLGYAFSSSRSMSSQHEKIENRPPNAESHCLVVEKGRRIVPHYSQIPERHHHSLLHDHQRQQN